MSEKSFIIAAATILFLALYAFMLSFNDIKDQTKIETCQDTCTEYGFERSVRTSDACICYDDLYRLN